MFNNVLFSFQVHDSTVERSPLFEYSVPVNVDHVLLTDKLLFVTSAKETPSMKVLANLLTEVSEDRNVRYLELS